MHLDYSELISIENLFQAWSEFRKGKRKRKDIKVFANIYLNELDQFVKHKLKMHYYIRYADDFLFLSKNKESLNKYVEASRQFLSNELKLELHPDKIKIRRLDNGIDFLGYVVLSHYVLPRTKTKRRIFKRLKEKMDDFKNKKISEASFNQICASYFGFLKHANTYELTQNLSNMVRYSHES